MLNIQDLQHYLNTLLKPELFSDYCPNGLQVSGAHSISKIVTGVTACQALIDEAIRLKADALLVHHGYFWKGENPCLIGIKRERLASILSANMNLLAYHLPLDAHPEFGNNAQLAKQLNIQVDDSRNICWVGNFKEALSGENLAARISEKLNREPLHIPAENRLIKRVAWVTGAAQDFIDQALQLNADAFITGEVSEKTVHFARENGLHFYAAGHHATERYGVKALGEHLAAKFNLTCEFIDIPNPV